MGLAPAQPNRPMLAAACRDVARAHLGDQYVLAGYRMRGSPAPQDSDAALPTVRVQIQMAAAVAGGAAMRTGPRGAGLYEAPVQTRSGTRRVRVLLARLAPGADVSGADRGVLDPLDGYGGRVVRLGAGDMLYVPAAAVGADAEAAGGDAVITITTVATDETCWVGEGSV